MAIGTKAIEQYVPIVKYNEGLYTALPIQTTGDLTVGGNLNVTGDIVVDDVTIDALTVTGNTVLGNAVTDTTTITGATTINSTAAVAFAVGATAAGANPALLVNAATASSATGVSITSAAAAGGVALAAISSGTDESLTINAKGSGTVTINGTATGNIVLGAAMIGVSASLTGGYTAKSGTAVPASAGALAAGAPITMFSTGIKIWVTSDTPAFSATKGDICINTGGSSSSTRLYINNGTTNWVAITTAS